MREVADRERIGRVMEALARAAGRETQVFLVGGTTAVLLGWRTSTIAIDLVVRMLAGGVIDAVRARRYFAEIEPMLYRFPAIDPPSFRRAIEEMLPVQSA